MDEFKISNKKYSDKILWEDLKDKCYLLSEQEELIEDLIKKRENVIKQNIDKFGWFSDHQKINEELKHLINSSDFDINIEECYGAKTKWRRKSFSALSSNCHSISFKDATYAMNLTDLGGLVTKSFGILVVHNVNNSEKKITTTYTSLNQGENSASKFLSKVEKICASIESGQVDKRIQKVIDELPPEYFFEPENIFYKTSSSKYPTTIEFDKNYDRSVRSFYEKESKKLVFETNLPLWEEKLSAAEKKGYNKYIYALTLSLVKNIFGLDYNNEIDTLVFNGRVETYNNVTGEEINPIILSLIIEREEFEKIKNFEKVDPEAWYKKNKGTSAAYLSDMVAIKPHSQIFEEDSRIIEPYKVADGLSDDENIATMHWKDFENLVREIFEKEFADKGFDVKITQSSKDGGVDAIIYDPNPLTGGKIIIQAKRYTNVVGVAAVRELYGTVLNEGANKGILVTTAYYGKDAYDFVKDKPITLIDGPNLLYLLNKHNYSMTIDLEEAKKELKEQGQ